MGSYRNKRNKKYYRINQWITAPTIRLLQADGKQLGVLTLNEARQKAQESGLDLVEIAPKAKPPVVKLIDFAKFKYQEAKKLKAEKKGSKAGGLKEIQANPFISQNDYQTKLKRAIKFLNTGNKVKLSIKFHGRQIIHKEFGHDLVEKFKNDLIDIATPEGTSRFMGKRLITIFTVVKKKTAIKKDTNEKNQGQQKI